MGRYPTAHVTPMHTHNLRPSSCTGPRSLALEPWPKPADEPTDASGNQTCGAYPDQDNVASLPFQAEGGMQVLTVVLIDQAVADLIGCNLAVGLRWLSPAHLGHGGGDNVESQTPRLTGYWGGGAGRELSVAERGRSSGR